MNRLKLPLALVVILVACSTQNSFSESVVSPYSSFLFGNNLQCVVISSTEKADIGKTISLLGLETDRPHALFDSGTDSPMKKVSEYENALAIQLVTPSGSIDSILLDKKTGLFVRSAMGNSIGMYAIASKGACK